MKIQFEIKNKQVFFAVIFISFITLLTLAIAITAVNPGHTSNDVIISIGGTEKTLQSAIDAGDLGKDLGITTWQVTNADEDIYYAWEVTTGNVVDVCNGAYSPYTCLPNETRDCIDVRIDLGPIDYMGQQSQTVYQRRIVCKKLKIPGIIEEKESLVFSFSGRVDYALTLTLKGKTVTQSNEQYHGDLSMTTSFYGNGIPTDGKPLKLLYSVSRYGGSVTISQQPTSANNYAVVVQLSDSQDGEFDPSFLLSKA